MEGSKHTVTPAYQLTPLKRSLRRKHCIKEYLLFPLTVWLIWISVRGDRKKHTLELKANNEDEADRETYRKESKTQIK